MWNLQHLARLAAEALEHRARDLDREQAVEGLDARDEVDLHPILARACADEGFGVHREVPYPTAPRRRALRSERPRCDLVLTPEASQAPADPLFEDRLREDAHGMLFAPAPRPVTLLDPRECFWLEVKVVGQFACAHGVPGPNGAYGTELTRAMVSDLAKLAADPALGPAGLLLILFTADERTARHDVELALSRALARGVRAGFPATRSFPITDRMNNARCTVALVPTWAGL